MNTKLDPTAAEIAKKEGMEKVYENSPVLWRVHAKLAVQQLAKSQPELTSDDVWKVLYKPKNPKALGPVLKVMAEGGWIRPTDRVKKSDQVSNHRRPIAIWESCVYKSVP